MDAICYATRLWASSIRRHCLLRRRALPILLRVEMRKYEKANPDAVFRIDSRNEVHWK